MNAITTPHNALDAGSVPVSPYKVDTSAGEMRGDVSMQWASRPADQKFDTLGDLYRFKKDIADRAHDVFMTSNDFEAVSPSLDFDTHGMSDAAIHAEAKRRTQQLFLSVNRPIGGDRQNIELVPPTNWAFSQLAQIADFRGSELRKLPTPIACDVLNWQLRHGSGRQELKTYLTPEEIMAAQSPTYGRVLDHDVIAALMMIAGEGKGEDSRYHWKAPGRLNWSNGTYDPEDIGPAGDRTFYGSDRDMFCFLVDDRRPIEVGKTRDGNPDLMFRGFYVQNSMVGARSLKIACFYLRGVCMNRNLWGVENFNEVMIRHTSGAPERWLTEAQPALESFAAGSDRTLIEGVERAKAKALIEEDKDAFAYLKRRGFTEKDSKAIIATGIEEEGRSPRTVWDFGQAITAHARTARNSDTRLDMELKAKTIFDLVK